MWTYARREISQKVKLKFGEAHALALTSHAGMVQIANALFSDGKQKPGGPPPGKDASRVDLAAGHGDVNSAIAAINAAMRF